MDLNVFKFKNPLVPNGFVIIIVFKNHLRDFPGGAVVKNPPASAGDTGSSPGPGRSHVLQSN